ncbi:MAG: Delta-aminolevulinic acid dehydratase [Pelotomaculum sp. PtaB.Bin104]|nr:MAG: Delta-aminolevulinic acid dehydratase [Pelotomaculum sp. PtaB.Bin104]
MAFPVQRMRRLRSSEAIRRMVRETDLSVDDLIYPLFVTHGEGVARPVEAMPGVCNYSIDRMLEELAEVARLKIPGILLFGIPAIKDEYGSEAYKDDGIVQRAVGAIKKEYPNLLVVTDICLCEYTSHGHCGLVRDGQVMNDVTLELLASIALSHAAVGADIVAPSDMMDGRVGAIRSALEAEGYENTLIMAYSAKYASAFYGPFREAAGSAPQFGDRKSYQMDPANANEALREVQQDIEEGADIVMVKPALAYLDVIRRVKEQFHIPLAAYNVSGEYSMVKAAVQQGWVDEKRVVLELLTGIKRAGSDIIITYHAKDVAKWLQEGVEP